MQPVVIEVIYPQVLQRLGKDGPKLVFALNLEHGHFIGDGEGAARVALHHRLAEGGLAGAPVVHIRGVKIGKARLQKAVHHGLCGGKVNIRRVARYVQRQAHQAKPQFLHSASFLSPPGARRVPVFCVGCWGQCTGPSLPAPGRQLPLMHKPFYYYNTMARRCGKRKNSPAKKTAGAPERKAPRGP